ncbi:MAG TPA: 1,2-phenylacetyl-CoA epoxidase subunit PaaC, partial [Burkholderiaceae bacterium]|nr:1,2-phenylacetyl-CoA epoxidase subunit PaaC [Burkholderiaceae bacterium]
WQRLSQSTDAEVAGIAGKAVKEARYHQQHAADWAVRLGDGTDESAARMRSALELLWPYIAEMFEADDIDADAARSGLGPSRAELRDAWRAEVLPVLTEARLTPPAERAFRSTGTQGRHSEHMGYILAEMQHLQRAYPGGAW